MKNMTNRRYAALKAQAKVKQEPCEVWNLTKHRWYKWGKNQCMKHLLKDPVYNLLEVIINTCNLKQLTKASKQTLLDLYNKKHPNHTISRATLYRYLIILEKHKMIKNYGQQEYNKPTVTRLLAPKVSQPSVSSCDTNNLYTYKLNNSATPHPSEGSLATVLTPEQQEQNKNKARATFKDLTKMLNTPRKQ